MRPSILFGSLALILGLTNGVSAQIVLVQPSWAPTPIFVCQSFALQEAMIATAAAPANSLPTRESRYGNAAVISAPVQAFVATPQPVRLERYYFIASPMEPIVPPSVDPQAVLKHEVASPFGEVIIREYFVMDRPVSAKSQSTPLNESSAATTPQNSSQEKAADTKSGKLDKPKWSEEFDKSEKAPESSSDTTVPVEPKETPSTPADESKEKTPSAEEKNAPAPTDPIAPATTPGAAI